MSLLQNLAQRSHELESEDKLKPLLETHQNIDINTITLPTKQPRRYFDPLAMEKLIESVKRYGVLENLIVRPLPNNTLCYELVAGERRYRAAIAAGLTEVPVTVRLLDDAQALSIALIENLQRADLNPIEETEGVLQLLSLHMQVPVEGITALLYRLQREKREQSAHNVISNQQVKQVETVFSELGKFTWKSFVSNRLPLLKLPEEILSLVREGRIAYTKAQAIARVKNDSFRQQLLQETITQNLSLGQIRNRIGTELFPDLPNSKIPENTLQQTYRRIQASRIWEDPVKWEKVKVLLRELSSLLQA